MGNFGTRFAGSQQRSQHTPGSGGGSSRGTRRSGTQGWMVPTKQQQCEQDGDPFLGDEFGAHRENLQAALDLMANFLAEHYLNLTIVAVGGPINTLLLKEQRTRQHLDYLEKDFGLLQPQMFQMAARYAESRCLHPLGDAWFSKPGNKPLKLPAKVYAEIIRKADEQKEIFFQKPGLTILAAPWDYAFCASVARLGLSHPSSRRPHELSDAVAYLHRYIQTHGDRPVSIQEIASWARAYGTPHTERTVLYVAACYHNTYGHRGVIDVVDSVMPAPNLTFQRDTTASGSRDIS